MAREKKTTATPRASSRRRTEQDGDKETVLGAMWEWTKSIIIGFIIFMVIRTFLIQTFTIISGSMENTLLIGDFLVLSKSAYGATVPGTDMRLPGYSQPRRNDIVVFRSHHEPVQIDLVKRLVGMPGDTLQMTAGVLSVNGTPESGKYVKHSGEGFDCHEERMLWQRGYLVSPDSAQGYYPTRDNWGPIVVPANSYFMMGDNRESSLDSRYWGFVPREHLMGRAVALYFSFDKSADSSVPFFGNVRWNRIGDRLR